MQRLQAVTIIKRGMGYRATQDQTIIDALKAAQSYCELGKTQPRFLFDIAQVNVPANTATFTLPVNFNRLVDDDIPYYINSSGGRVDLPRQKYSEALKAYYGSNGMPLLTSSPYAKVFDTRTPTSGILVPTPNAAFTFFLPYYKNDQTLDNDNTENLWMLHVPYLLIGLAGMDVAENVRDKDAYSKFERMAKMHAISNMNEIVDAELAGRGLVMGRNN